MVSKPYLITSPCNPIDLDGLKYVLLPRLKLKDLSALPPNCHRSVILTVNDTVLSVGCIYFKISKNILDSDNLTSSSLTSIFTLPITQN